MVKRDMNDEAVLHVSLTKNKNKNVLKSSEGLLSVHENANVSLMGYSVIRDSQPSRPRKVWENFGLKSVGKKASGYTQGAKQCSSGSTQVLTKLRVTSCIPCQVQPPIITKSIKRAKLKDESRKKRDVFNMATLEEGTKKYRAFPSSSVMSWNDTKVQVESQGNIYLGNTSRDVVLMIANSLLCVLVISSY